MELKKYLITAAALGLVTGAAWAKVADTELGQQNREAAQAFDELDANGDGILSRDELQAASGDAADVVSSIGEDKEQISFSEFIDHWEGAGSTGGAGMGSDPGAGAGGMGSDAGADAGTFGDEGAGTS